MACVCVECGNPCHEAAEGFGVWHHTDEEQIGGVDYAADADHAPVPEEAPKLEALDVEVQRELLEACEAVDEWFDVIKQCYPEMRFPAKVRAALAMARGRTP